MRVYELNGSELANWTQEILYETWLITVIVDNRKTVNIIAIVCLERIRELGYSIERWSELQSTDFDTRSKT